MKRIVFAVLLVGLVGAGGVLWSRRSEPPRIDVTEQAPWFQDVTEEVGLDFLHDAGPTGDYFMPQQVGSGAALFDYDNDGRLDIYLLQNGGPGSGSKNRLFRQQADGKYRDVSGGSGLDFDGNNIGVAVGDINNDGWLDVLVTQYPGAKLLLNKGDGTFQDITESAGLKNPSWGSSAAFFDYDRDGWLDLIVVCYVDYDPTWPCTGPAGTRDYCAPKNFKGRVSRLFHNLGKQTAKQNVRFAEVTIPSGLGQIPGPGLGVLCADFNGDGWQDIFVANDGEPNRLWINRHDGTFAEESLLRGIAYDGQARAMAGMGVAFGDVDADGLLDVFVTHLTEENHTLWQQKPRGLFLDATRRSGLLSSRWRGTGFGTVFGDFDLDGDLDLAIANGRVAASSDPGDGSLGPFWSYYGERNQLFSNAGKGVFRDVSLENAPFCEKMNMGRGLARGDFDGDGALDLLVTSIAGRARLYRNVAASRGRWLTVRAVDPALKRDALGTEIRVRADGRAWVHWLHPAESYLCSSEPRAHVGLGPVSKVDSITLVWPDGTREVFPGGPVNRHVVLRKGEGRPVEAVTPIKRTSHDDRQRKRGA